MTTLNLTPEQKEAVWNALEDRVDKIKEELINGIIKSTAVASREELKAAREILEIFESTIGRSHLLHH